MMQYHETLARLGDSSGHFVSRLGRPTLVVSVGVGIVRRFTAGEQTLTVLFDRDRAIVIHYPLTALRDPGSANSLGHGGFQAGSGAAQLVPGRFGWLLTDPACPPAAVSAVEDLIQDRT